MNIDELTNQEKSVMLAKAMEWEVTWNIYGLGHVESKDGDVIWGVLDDTNEDILSCLYDPENMPLAWRVHDVIYDFDDPEVTDEMLAFWYDLIERGGLGTVEAQKKWLDKILTLCHEAGLVEDA